MPDRLPVAKDRGPGYTPAVLRPFRTVAVFGLFVPFGILAGALNGSAAGMARSSGAPAGSRSL